MLLVSSVKVHTSFTASTVNNRGLMKSGEISSGGVYFYLWWIILAARFSVPSIMELVFDMAVESKR